MLKYSTELRGAAESHKSNEEEPLICLFVNKKNIQNLLLLRAVASTHCHSLFQRLKHPRNNISWERDGVKY